MSEPNVSTEAKEPSAPSAAKPKGKEARRRIVAALRGVLNPEWADAGMLAALRRADPDLPPTAFYRVATSILDEHLGVSGASRDEKEAQWVIVASAMARAQGMLARIPLGQALATAGVAEMRFMRLLEAGPSQIAVMVRNVVHQLTQKGQPFDPDDLADLVLTVGTDGGRTVRRRIARDYYRHEGN